jgi:hypothetical protein
VARHPITLVHRQPVLRPLNVRCQHQPEDTRGLGALPRGSAGGSAGQR